MRAAVRQRQKGIAALTAILVVAIATVLAVNLLWTTSVDIQRTQGILMQDQARLYDLGGEELAKSLLALDYRDKPDGTDTIDLKTNIIVSQFQDGVLEGWVVDQQGLFDLNSLVSLSTTKVDEVAREQFVRLITLVDRDNPVDSATAEALADATVDWIDPDDSVQGDGAEEDNYTSLDPGYRPANFWFTSISELQAVKGFTPELLKKLWPHVTALPRQESGERWALNLNTATDLVMASLVDGLTADKVGALCPYDKVPHMDPTVKVCTGEVFADINDFTTRFGEISPGVPVPTTIPIDLRSSWFLITVTTSIGTSRSTMYSLLERQEGVVTTRLRTFDAN